MFDFIHAPDFNFFSFSLPDYFLRFSQKGKNKRGKGSGGS
ncbi:hypothetical protein C900_01152 [Fulvivirga imtechensis AK7]|uniref:Uncharacterized protein n=1 Tax=Fulvivirga imtechensis AK7 TaxID=1237149 RepID=L8JX74_9BACT|nr:hypothetical protein C900_01152 [Fulvivirga imtechensis AK7]